LSEAKLHYPDGVKAESALRQHDSRYQEIFEHSPIGIFRTTIDGRVVIANPAILRMLRYDSMEELRNISVETTTYHPDHPRDEFIRIMDEKNEINGYETKWVRKDGTILHVKESARTVRSDKGEIIYFDGTVEDISEQKEAEIRLARRLKVDRALAEISTIFLNITGGGIEAALTSAIGRLCTLEDLDRGSIFLFDENAKSADAVCEWAGKGVAPNIGRFKELPSSEFKWLQGKLLSKQIINIPRVADLPPDAAAEKKSFEAAGVRSVLLVPLISGAKVMGCLGVDSVRREISWDENHITMFRLLSEICASALNRRKTEQDMNYRISYENVVARMSSRFANILPMGDELDEALVAALEDIGMFCGVDRVCIMMYSKDCRKLEEVQQWCRYFSDDIEPKCKRFILDGTSQLGHMLQYKSHLTVESMRDSLILSDSEKRYFSGCGIESLILVPWSRSDGAKGCIGMFTPLTGRIWSDDEVRLLRIAGEMAGTAVDKEIGYEKIESGRRLLQALMDGMPDRIYFKDRDCRLILASNALARAHGFHSGEELIGKTDWDLFTRPHAEQAFHDDNEVIQTGRPVIGKEEMETWKDGKEGWVSTTKLPLFDDKGKIIGLMGISRDITAIRQAQAEKKLLECQVMQSQKMESLGVMCGGIAHDFNNFLMGILGNTGLALMDLERTSPAWKHVKQIEEVTLKAAELTSQLLAYSGKSEFAMQSLNVTDLVREMVNLLKISIPRNIRIVYNLIDGILAVNGDPVQIRQVLMNLVINASEAIGKNKGTITIGSGLLTCGQDFFKRCVIRENMKPGDYVAISVRDTGCGMTEKVANRIFDPFYTTKESGHGLGTAVVHGVVKAHGGNIMLTTVEGKGTEFLILLPAVQNLTVRSDHTHSGKHELKPGSLILVVDDDEVVRTVASRILEGRKMKALSSADAESAMAILRKYKMQLAMVLMDVNLSGAGVRDLLREIRTEIPGLPVVLMSGYGEAYASEELNGAPYEGFLQKPFNAEQLIAKLGTVMRDWMENGGVK
jgi:PAS domain S-box-containing protein